MLYKACSKCGRIHDSRFKCTVGKVYNGGDERKLRAKNKWHQKSMEIRERANFLCEVCRKENVFTYNDLDVHHITKVTEDPDLLLDNYNLICLCRYHHRQADSGEIPKDYLLKLAEERESKSV